MCHLEMHNFKEAAADGDVVIKLKPTWVNGHLRKGGAMFALGRFEDARQAYQVRGLSNRSISLSAFSTPHLSYTLHTTLYPLYLSPTLHLTCTSL